MVRRLVIAAACLAALPVAAHEFIVKPGVTEVAAGAPVPITAISSHVFMVGEELEPADDVAAWVVSGGQRQPVALTPDPEALAYTGSATAPTAGGFLIAGCS